MIGKRVGGDLYLHKSSVPLATIDNKEIIKDSAKNLTKGEKRWNVVRIGNDNIAFLFYKFGL